MQTWFPVTISFDGRISKRATRAILCARANHSLRVYHIDSTHVFLSYIHMQLRKYCGFQYYKFFFPLLWLEQYVVKVLGNPSIFDVKKWRFLSKFQMLYNIIIFGRIFGISKVEYYYFLNVQYLFSEHKCTFLKCLFDNVGKLSLRLCK